MLEALGESNSHVPVLTSIVADAGASLAAGRRVTSAVLACRFAAIERGSKLIPAWHLGRRVAHDPVASTGKVNGASDGHFRITAYGFKPHVDGIHYSLGARADLGQLVRVYGSAPDREHC